MPRLLVTLLIVQKVIRVIVHMVKLFPRNHHTWSILRLGQVRLGHTSHWAGGQSHGLAWVRVMVHTVKLFPRSHHMWSILRLGQVRLGQVRLGQGTRPTRQAVRVMVWLGLESWSTQLNCSIEVITCGVSLGQVMLGQGTHPTGQAVRVMVRHGPLGRRLESWFAFGQSLGPHSKLFP